MSCHPSCERSEQEADVTRTSYFLIGTLFVVGLMLLASEDPGYKLLGGCICFGLGLSAWLTN